MLNKNKKKLTKKKSGDFATFQVARTCAKFKLKSLVLYIGITPACHPQAKSIGRQESPYYLHPD